MSDPHSHHHHGPPPCACLTTILNLGENLKRSICEKIDQHLAECRSLIAAPEHDCSITPTTPAVVLSEALITDQQQGQGHSGPVIKTDVIVDDYETVLDLTVPPKASVSVPQPPVKSTAIVAPNGSQSEAGTLSPKVKEEEEETPPPPEIDVPKIKSEEKQPKSRKRSRSRSRNSPEKQPRRHVSKEPKTSSSSRSRSVSVSISDESTGGSRAGHHHKFHTQYLNCIKSSCKGRFKCREELTRHILTEHSSVDPFPCPLHRCGRGYRTRFALEEHFQIDHAHVREWHCFKCTDHYARGDTLYMHYVFNHNSGSYTCAHEGCSVEASYAADILSHYKRSHREDYEISKAAAASSRRDNCHKYTILAVKCTDCIEWFIDVEELEEHLRAEHNVRWHRCPAPRCKASFVSKYEVSKHIHEDHADRSTWRCYKCDISFSRGISLALHYFLVHHEGNFSCSRCSFKAKLRTDVMTHYDHEHEK